MKLSPIAQKRWRNFKRNHRAYWALWLFLALFILSCFAEFIANDRPIYVRYQGENRFPIWQFYSEQDFGGDYLTEADYRDPLVTCLIRTGGNADCFQNQQLEGDGIILWPVVKFDYNTVDKTLPTAYQPPSASHWFGTDGQSRDVFARVLYGFRLNVFFAIIVTAASSAIGIFLGGISGYFAGRIDILLQRFVEIWTTMPTLYVIIILASFTQLGFWSLCLVVTLFSWTGLVGVVRAEFLRARNFEYVRAAKALGLSNIKIMHRHVLPNAMVATLTYMPFILTGSIGTLAMLDFLGFGLPASYPSLGEMAGEARTALDAWWLIWAAFFTYTIILALLIFIFEGVRDAFDPRKVFHD